MQVRYVVILFFASVCRWCDVAGQMSCDEDRGEVQCVQCCCKIIVRRRTTELFCLTASVAQIPDIQEISEVASEVTLQRTRIDTLDPLYNYTQMKVLYVFENDDLCDQLEPFRMRENLDVKTDCPLLSTPPPVTTTAQQRELTTTPADIFTTQYQSTIETQGGHSSIPPTSTASDVSTGQSHTAPTTQEDLTELVDIFSTTNPLPSTTRRVYPESTTVQNKLTTFFLTWGSTSKFSQKQTEIPTTAINVSTSELIASTEQSSFTQDTMSVYFTSSTELLEYTLPVNDTQIVVINQSIDLVLVISLCSGGFILGANILIVALVYAYIRYRRTHRTVTITNPPIYTRPAARSQRAANRQRR